MSEIVWRSSVLQPQTRVALRWWKNVHKTELPARGYVWFLHGVGEHSGRYDEFARTLTNFGFDVIAPDHAGHGLTAKEGGQKRLVSFDDMVLEARRSLAFWIQEGPVARKGLAHTPWILGGHSMGALMALEWLRQGKRENEAWDFAHRAFVSAPPLKLRLTVPAWKESASRLLERVVPYLKLSNEISPDFLSYDAGNVAAYRADPLVHGYVTPRLYCTMTDAASRILAQPQQIEIPLCLAVGEDDPIVDPAALRAYYETLATHKRFTAFPHMKHEILNETDRASVYKVFHEWIL